MTRLLSELLGASEPHFRFSLRELERASGGPSADIRLTTEILHQTQAKLRELGLDPLDTTGSELYGVLQQRLLDDDRRLHDTLGLEAEASSPEILAAVQQFIRRLDVPRGCFALKLSVAKRLLRAVPPKNAMKQLGYRSLDSMLKHEPVPQLYAAAFITESSHWQKAFTRQYERLQPGDFEHRQIAIYYPRSSRWELLAQQLADRFKHTNMAFQELGVIVVLPVVADIPALAITNVLLTLENVNDIRCNSALLKLQQVKPDFGKLVAQIAHGEPYNVAQLGGRSLPWQIMQYYYSKLHVANIPALFEPHIQPEDLELVKAESALAHEIPALEFWEDTGHLALVKDGQPVSLNMLDVALSVANQLPFAERIVHYVRDHTWRELLMRYLNPYNLERVLGQLGDELVETPALEAEMAQERQ